MFCEVAAYSHLLNADGTSVAGIVGGLSHEGINAIDLSQFSASVSVACRISAAAALSSSKTRRKCSARPDALMEARAAFAAANSFVPSS